MDMARPPWWTDFETSGTFRANENVMERVMDSNELEETRYNNTYQMLRLYIRISKLILLILRAYGFWR